MTNPLDPTAQPSLEDGLQNPYEPELGTIPASDRDEETVNKTGTTTVGIATENGVSVTTTEVALT